MFCALSAANHYGALSCLAVQSFEQERSRCCYYHRETAGDPQDEDNFHSAQIGREHVDFPSEKLWPLGPKPRVSEMRILRFAVSYGGRLTWIKEESGVTSDIFCRVSKDVREPVRVVAQIEVFRSQSIAVIDIKSLRSFIVITQVDILFNFVKCASIGLRSTSCFCDRRDTKEPSWPYDFMKRYNTDHTYSVWFAVSFFLWRDTWLKLCRMFGVGIQWRKCFSELSVFFSTARLRITYRYSVLRRIFIEW